MTTEKKIIKLLKKDLEIIRKDRRIEKKEVVITIIKDYLDHYSRKLKLK